MAALGQIGYCGAINTTNCYYVIKFYVKPTHYKKTQPDIDKLVQRVNWLSRRSI